MRESPVSPSVHQHQQSSTYARSPVHRIVEVSFPECHSLCHYGTPTPNTEQFLTDFNDVAWDDDTTSPKENFPTAPLDDEVRYKDPIPDRHLFINETPHEPNLQCPYPCPYSKTTFRIDLPQSTPEDAAVFHYELMDFSDISSDFPDIMTTTSENDIPDLVDILDAEHLDYIQHGVWFA